MGDALNLLLGVFCVSWTYKEIWSGTVLDLWSVQRQDHLIILGLNYMNLLMCSQQTVQLSSHFSAKVEMVAVQAPADKSSNTSQSSIVVSASDSELGNVQNSREP
jgi:hypothetical protein